MSTSVLESNLREGQAVFMGNLKMASIGYKMRGKAF